MSINKILTEKLLSIFLLLLMLGTGASEAWGQESTAPTPKVPDGIYYIHHSHFDKGPWYLWPSVVTNTSTSYPYLTTFNGTTAPAVANVYPAYSTEYCHWIVKNVTVGDDIFIQMRNAKTGKYIIRRNKTLGDRDVWLVDNLPTGNNAVYSYFNLVNEESPYRISIPNEDKTYSFNVAKEDKAGLGSGSSGKDISDQRPGLIQLYTSGDPKWTFESHLLPTQDILTINFDEVVGSYTFSTTLYEGFTIRYTEDGSDPVTNPNNTARDYDGSTIVVEQDGTTVKAVVMFEDIQLTDVAEKVVYTPKPVTPSLEVTCDSKLQLSTNKSTAKLYYTYTTNGSDPADPTNADTEWTGPVDIPDGAKVKAIAYNGSTPSDVSAVYTFKRNTAAPTITLAETTATITFTEGTIHYTSTTNGMDPNPEDAGVSTSPFEINGLDFDTDVDIRVIATSEGRGNSCPVTVMKRPRRPSFNTESDCVGSTRTHSLTFNNTLEGRTYWYALTNGRNSSAPALNTFHQYTPGTPVNIATIPGWSGTDIYVTLHGYAKDADGYTSAVTSVDYMLKYTEAPTITHTTNGANTTVTIEAVSGAKINYSVDNGAVQTATTNVSFEVSNTEAHIIIATAKKDDEGESCETIHSIVLGTTITTLTELQGMTENGAYVLGADIDTNGSFTTISNFTGSLDGKGYTISGLTQPLFGMTNGATIHDLNLKSVNISKTGDVGAIVCDAKGYTRIYNCGILPTTADFPAGTHSRVEATGSDGCAGSLVGKLEDDSRVVNCFSYADVTSSGAAAGIVGNNTFASNTAVKDGYYAYLKTMVVNCMYYGNASGSNVYPVYGGKKINNTGDANAINNYNFYSVGCKFTGTLSYYCAWPAKLEYLTRYEYHRNLLNSNRELCGWWVGAYQAPSTMATTAVQNVKKDASLMLKWVLDPAVAPYPILKPFGYYSSPINIDADATWRTTANEWEGKNLGTIGVTINPGDHAPSGVSQTAPVSFTITDMDTLRADYCYRKIQLPYYNKVFGDPNGADWEAKYAGNYTEWVVTGWEITYTNGAEGTFTANWETGYNFADRNSSKKDKNRIFAQGGYYYVPNDVSAITITAHWAKAYYLDNSSDHSYDRVYMSGANAGTHFAPAGSRGETLGNGQTVYSGTINFVASQITSTDGVYDNAIVLVGNHQYRTDNANITGNGYTIMSADLDFDNEPDHCLIWQLGHATSRYDICPIRFDFLPIVEIGMAMKEDGSTQYYSLGCYRPLGHFEVTETSLIHFGQFEFSNKARSKEAPLILNGGIYDQYTKGTLGRANDYINYIIIGGHVRIPSFTPGAHPSDRKEAILSTRHCAVNVLGGNIDYLYLTGNYNEAITPNTDNPHCYIDGGRFKHIAAAGKEGINGDVYFKINHSKIWEFYGGSTMAADDKLVTGNINVNIDNSIVEKYCGGPKFGNMNTAQNKKVTTNAKKTIFTDYYGGGNGGTSYVQYKSTDNTVNDATAAFNWSASKESKGGDLMNFSPGDYYTEDNKGIGYMADYEMEIVNSSAGTDSKKAIFRTYFYAAQFSATNTGPIENNLTDCKVLKNFYGGGNLGGVIGDVTSTLKNTEVFGSAFGAGFSASVPEVTIHNKDKDYPTINVYTGIIKPTPEGSGTSTTYTWTNETSLGGETLSTSNPKVMNVGGKNYFYTEESLENLGTVTGNVTLNIAGSTMVHGKVFDENGNEIAENIDRGGVFGGGNSSDVTGNTTVTMTSGTVEGSIFGGANLAKVNGDTNVEVSGGTIGKENAPVYAALVGNVFGGGKGNSTDVKAGLVTGDTHVTISGNAESPFLYHNVYGGGAYGSVGEFEYDATTGMPIGRKSETSGGNTNVTIAGGKIGTTGQNNGMVFGSSRGDVDVPGGDGIDQNDRLAWAYDTRVVIGEAAKGTTSSGDGKSYDYPQIKGSVYGSGENGHTFHDTEVKVHSGTIGIVSGEEITYNGIKYSGPRFAQRGNVYGSGCGTDTYEAKDAENKTKTYYNFNAGIVKGNTKVLVDGGLVVHNVYGGGSMASVGTYTFDDNKKPISCAENTGKCNVTVKGGCIGVPGMQMAAGGGPDDYGHVFGAGRGEAKDPDEYPNVEITAFYNQSDLAIEGSALVMGSVYGGSESGHVLNNTLVKIKGGQVGCGDGLSEAYTEDDWAVESPTTLKPTNHWTYVDDGAPYDQFADENGNYANNVTAEGGNRKATDGHTFYGNVFGGGSGYYPYAQGQWLFTAGGVGGNTKVEISGGHILNNVYGGCEMTNVDGDATIEMTGGTVGVPLTKGSWLHVNPTFGHIFGAGMGDKRIFFNTVTNVENSYVTVSGGRVYGSVHGGGEDGHVINKATTIIKEDDPVNEPTIIGSVTDGSTSGFDGNVFGGGQGSPTALTAGTVGGNVELNIQGGTMHGSVYGGGRIASVGLYFALTSDENYGKMQHGDDHGYITVNLTGGTIVHNVYGGCMGTRGHVIESSAAEDSQFAVSKTINVNLNGYETSNGPWTVADDARGCVVKGNIFGCNNVNSSPQQDVTVHVYATQSVDADRITNSATGEQNAKVLERYDVNAVYGGGNMAHYKPHNSTSKNYFSHVIIDGCDRTSIRQVYGGGNAATVPSTEVTVNGSFEIDELFGGGNGADQITYDEGATMLDNPGANVGFYAYDSKYDNPPYTKADREQFKYETGTGIASVNIYGGVVNKVFGGSNTKGNVRETAITLLEEKKKGGTGEDKEDPECPFQVGEVYGGGKSAPMDADAKLLMQCIPGLRSAYGGAEDADLQGGVTLTITNGTFERVFGGNNLSGTIRGPIEVNIEETGCRPIIIGELYGGGNQAPYSVYGYNADGTIIESGTTKAYKDPVVNVKSFTSIGNVFGGGYGSGATMVGDPTVNINVAYGEKKDYTDNSTYTDGEDIVRYYDENGFKELTKEIDGHSVIMPQHKTNAIGAINYIYGGGNEAKVKGNTKVNIGTVSYVYMLVNDDLEENVTDVSSYYTRTGGEGTASSPYEYTPATGTAVDGTTYYKKCAVIGADIRGNVYGGGNNAEVTGDTDVVIGQKKGE